MHIARRHRVSEHTVRAIRAREAVAIAERKQRLVSIFGNVAEIAAECMEELAGQASLRDAGTTAGIATDKLLALSGDPALTIQHDVILHQQRRRHELLAVMVKLGMLKTDKIVLPPAVKELIGVASGDASVAQENAAQKES